VGRAQVLVGFDALSARDDEWRARRDHLPEQHERSFDLELLVELNGFLERLVGVGLCLNQSGRRERDPGCASGETKSHGFAPASFSVIVPRLIVFPGSTVRSVSNS